MSNKEVIFFLPSLKFGGAERALLLAANGLSECKNIDVRLITLQGGELETQICHNLKWEKLNGNRLIWSIPKIVKKLFNKDALVITTLVHCNIILIIIINAMRFLKLSKCKICVRETTNLSARLKKTKSFKLKALSFLIPKMYKSAKYVVFPNFSMLKAFERDFSLKLGNSKVIYNPANIVTSNVESFKSKIDKIIVVGRLTIGKGIEEVLAAFACVLHKNSTMTLDIVGDGPLRGKLEKRAIALGVDDKVSFKGFVLNPFRTYRNQGVIYVLASHMEGMPNGLIEALSNRIPCVSYDCDYGPREVFEIFNIPEKYLVPVGDASKLALKIIEATQDNEYFHYMKKDSWQAFSLPNYINSFKSLI